MDFNNKVMETLTAITENNEEDKQDLANLKQSLIDGTFNVKYLTWAIMATNDENGNRIIDTYATIERLTQVLEALTQEISDRKSADDLEKNERKEETSAIINSVNQEISDRTNAVSVLNNLLTAETENRTSEDEKVLQYAQSVNEALGNAKTDLQGKIDSEAQTRLTSDNEIKASITSKEDSLKALINSVKNELNGSITTLNNRVNNLPTNYVFDTYESMTNDLLNASNTKYKVGDTLFIKEVNKPDYWISAILSTKGTYGYYELSEQESKVDLSNYVKISELSRETIEEKFLETLENGITKSFASSSFTATDRNSGIDINNYAQYCADGVSFHKNGMEYPIAFPEKDGILALTSDIPQALKNPFALTINGKVYDGSSAVEVITETITEHDFVRFWHDGIEIQNDGSEHVLRFSDFDTELEEFSPHISCQYDGPQYYWVWKFPQISGTFAMESQIPTKLSQLKNDGNYQTNTSDLKDNTTTFTTATERSNVASGEKLSVSFGKIAKYFNDLKAVAFSGNKSDIGLGNVDNTSDKDKPVSTAQQQALNSKANASDVYTKTETDGLLNDKANKSDVYTKTETDNGINKSLYNLGYYDTMVENSDGSYTITRQTGYVDLGSLEWTEVDTNCWKSSVANFPNIYTSGKVIVGAKYKEASITDYSGFIALGVGYIGMLSTYEYIICMSNGKPTGFAQYKLATSYTEEIIEGQPLITLDQQGSQWLRNEWEKGYNLLNISSFIVDRLTAERTATGFKLSNSTYNYSYLMYDLSDLPNGKYTISFNAEKGSNTPFLNIYTGSDSNKTILSGYNSFTFTKSGDTLRILFYIARGSKDGYLTISNLILVSGNHALPYQPYNQSKHITNNEAEFLKTESDRSANLWDEQWEVGILNDTTGIKEDGYSNTIRSKNFIKCLPNTSYKNYVKNSTDLVMYVFFYDINKNFISKQNRYCNFDTGPFVTPNNCYYIMFYLQAIYGTTYNNDIMISEGSAPLPYQPYEGKVVHEKDLGDKLGGYLPLTGGVIDANGAKAPLILKGGDSNYKEGLRIIPTADWSTILLGGSDVQEDYGTSPNSWAILNKNGEFYISKNGADNASTRLYNNDGTWRLNNYIIIHEGNLVDYLNRDIKTINGNSIVGSGDLTITPGIFTKLGNKTNFSFDSGSYLVVANNGLVTVTGTDPLNVGSSANKKFVGIFMATIAEYGGGQSVCVNTEEVFSGEAASATISGPMFTIYRLN